MLLAGLLHPELRLLPAPERSRALRAARRVPFDILELVGLAAAIVAAPSLLREVGALAAVPLIAITAGPFLARRTRRGLRQHLGGRP